MGKKGTLVATYMDAVSGQHTNDELIAIGRAKSKLDILEEEYKEAAASLRARQAALGNYAVELDVFIKTRDTLREHPDFPGYLPQTYFSGGELDPDGDPGTRENSAPRG